MSTMGDLINFDIIETHKENIQSLPGGRSAKALAFTLAQSSLDPNTTLTSSDTKSLNDVARQEFETELLSISEADDPLDTYDRYVKWTLTAYPSVQATTQSGLLPLLERATKAFLTSAHYKNDPRYLKLWLHYIRLFSDTPRETFAFLARHHIGDGLALFYEEFAAWLEGQGRWAQAEEVYMMGIDREARPVERLARKLREFHSRSAHRERTRNGPSSPALPTVRPALAAKVDPFASAGPSVVDPQRTVPASRTSKEPAGQKLEVFSDADAPPPASSLAGGESTKGWENIGSIANRKKENVVEPKPWTGETLKAGKKLGSAPKMMIFRDENLVSNTTLPQDIPKPYDSRVIRCHNGRTERVFVNLDALYPNPDDPTEEMSIEEVRAAHRGWLDRKWPKEEITSESQGLEKEERLDVKKSIEMEKGAMQGPGLDMTDSIPLDISLAKNEKQQRRPGRPKRMGTVEVKGETQTIKTNLDSPSKPKLGRKSLGEPTMTFHTRAATDEIYDIFNQPLKLPAQDDDEAESDEEDYYGTGGETTIATERVSVTSGTEGPGVDEYTSSEWTEFSAKKHIPSLYQQQQQHCEGNVSDVEGDARNDGLGMLTHDLDELELARVEAPITPTWCKQQQQQQVRTESSTYIPMPTEDYESLPARSSARDKNQPGQGRFPVMTPIVERTESSFAPSTYAPRKEPPSQECTPSKAKEDDDCVAETTDAVDYDLMSSPFQEIINEAVARHKREIQSPRMKLVENHPSEVASFNVSDDIREKVSFSWDSPIIEDKQVIPTDESIRMAILEHPDSGLSTLEGFIDRRNRVNDKRAEIRKYIRTMKTSKGGSSGVNTNDKRSSASVARPPTLRFEGVDREYTVKRELGQGAFAPVYLVEGGTLDQNDCEDGNEVAVVVQHKNNNNHQRKRLEAIKMEDPPSGWEFYIMRCIESRLHQSSSSSHSSRRVMQSIIRARELHLFQDECFLIEDYRDQGTLLGLINVAKNDSSIGSSMGGILDETLTIFFTVELFRVVEALHAHGIIHGDLKADNCLVRLEPVVPHTFSFPTNSTTTTGDDIRGNSTSTIQGEWSSQYRADGQNGWAQKGIALIDFGRGIDMYAFRDDVTFLANWPVRVEDCVEVRQGRPWTYQVDYHGLADIIHTMLFGRYLDTKTLILLPSNANNDTTTAGAEDGSRSSGRKERYQLAEKFKRYWQVDLWTDVFDLLLNPLSYTPPPSNSTTSTVSSRSTDRHTGGDNDNGAAAAATHLDRLCQENEARGKWMMALPRLDVMRSVRRRLETWLEHEGSHRGLKELIKRVENRIGGGGGGHHR